MSKYREHPAGGADQSHGSEKSLADTFTQKASRVLSLMRGSF